MFGDTGTGEIRRPPTSCISPTVDPGFRSTRSLVRVGQERGRVLGHVREEYIWSVSTKRQSWLGFRYSWQKGKRPTHSWPIPWRGTVPARVPVVRKSPTTITTTTIPLRTIIMTMDFTTRWDRWSFRVIPLLYFNFYVLITRFATLLLHVLPRLKVSSSLGTPLERSDHRLFLHWKFRL